MLLGLAPFGNGLFLCHSTNNGIYYLDLDTNETYAVVDPDEDGIVGRDGLVVGGEELFAVKGRQNAIELYHIMVDDAGGSPWQPR